MNLKLALSALLVTCVSRLANAQSAGNFETEGNPTITLKECTNDGGCISTTAKVTLDANWRYIHVNGGYENCYEGNEWTGDFCSSGDPELCAKNCALEQVSSDKYENTYGIEQLDNGFRMNFVTEDEYGTNVGGRVYVLDGDDKYKMWHLKNREFSIDIDVSEVQCGMNGALYFVEMDELGGKNLGDNQAGAKYGTGYCDAQCPHDMKFISGEANVIDWTPNPKDFSNNIGGGKYGSCCAEMDIWEANSMATAYTPHPCNLGGNLSNPAQYKCEGIDCGDTDQGERYDGVCDKDGCDINPYRMGNKEFYGRGEEFTVNTLKPMTVVTQFLTTDGTDEGDLSEIRRFYVQDGNIIHSPASTILSNNADSITDEFCADKKELFENINDFYEKGGNDGMGESLDRGHVLALSLWDDVDVNMMWLDSAWPRDKPVDDPGIKRGDCPGGETSTPEYVRENFPDAGVTFQNAAIGEIGSTWPSASPTSAPTETAPCCSCNHRDCRVGWCSETEFNCSVCGNVWMPTGALSGCTDQFNECTDVELGCCNGLVCEGSETFKQCMVPVCEDDEDFLYKNKNCKKLTKTEKKADKYCKKKVDKDDGGGRVRDYCPKGCGECPA